MILEKILEGLKIIHKYEPNTMVGCEHEVIYAGTRVSVEDMTEEEKTRMQIQLGWQWNDEFDCWERYL